MPDITPEILAWGRTWLGPGFIDPEADRVYLSFHTYVVRTRHLTILVDTCNGNHKERLSMPAWHRLNTPYLEELAKIGLQPADIDVVLCTHLHADHIGWNTRLVDGQWVPTFPNARYLMGRAEFEHWHRLHQSGPAMPVNRGSFVDSVLPVVDAGQAVLVETDHVIQRDESEGVWLEPSVGHTPGHVCVHVEGGGRHALLAGDAIHHPVQLTYPDLAIAADFDRPRAAQTRRSLVERYADTKTMLLTAHFPTPTAGYIVRHKDEFRFRFGEE
jgi:glyoxylase-like metal-dependent hydrolase (beta-lactamase superfamily II)